MTHYKKDKFRVLFFGFVTGLLLLEISLRVMGFLHLQRFNKTQRVPENRGHVNILCVGDSCTFGEGAEIGRDFPTQLQEMFNQNALGKQVIVVKRGISGANTAIILGRLEQILNETSPDIVILWAGATNFINPYGYRSYLGKSDIKHRLRDWAFNVKLIKLIHFLSQDIANRWRDRKAHIGKRLWPVKNRIHDSSCGEWHKRSRESILKGDFEEAMRSSKQVIENFPGVVGCADFAYYLLSV